MICPKCNADLVLALSPAWSHEKQASNDLQAAKNSAEFWRARVAELHKAYNDAIGVPDAEKQMDVIQPAAKAYLEADELCKAAIAEYERLRNLVQ